MVHTQKVVKFRIALRSMQIAFIAILVFVSDLGPTAMLAGPRTITTRSFLGPGPKNKSNNGSCRDGLVFIFLLIQSPPIGGDIFCYLVMGFRASRSSIKPNKSITREK